MIVQLRGVNFSNKGSELMIHAVVQRMSDVYTDAIVAADVRTGNFHQRSEAGLHHLAAVYSGRYPIARPIVGSLASLVPRGLRQACHLVTGDQVEAVLDASGFAYTDQWGPRISEFTAQLCTIWKNAGKKIIFLPQAFGPFRGARIQRAVAQITAHADLMFARDRISYGCLLELAEDPSRIHLAPDFTNIVSGRLRGFYEALENQPCIIPNHKMVSKNSRISREAYVTFLVNSSEHLLAQGLKPFVLIHAEGEDLELAKSLQAQIQAVMQIVHEPSPILIKGIIGRSLIVIGARYHGLVSSLSQAVPSLGTGWSHKYELLFEDYGCPECLVSPRQTWNSIRRKIDDLIHRPSRSRLVARLEEASVAQRNLTVDMWCKVDRVLRGSSEE